MAVFKIPKTLAVISEAWCAAEEKLRKDMAEYSVGSDEEFITRFFHFKLAKALKKASDGNLIAKAFERDLQTNFPNGEQHQLGSIAAGLVADVTLHKREREKITGGDLGILLMCPELIHSWNSLKRSNSQRGLLCQAKLKNFKGKWGRLTSKQRTVLPERISYFALLLYHYTDVERRNLAPFGWQLCASLNPEDVERSLKSGNFPSVVESKTIISKLGNGTIGTGDKQIIDTYISTANSPCLVVRIDWRNSKYPPGSTIQLHTRTIASIRVPQRLA